MAYRVSLSEMSEAHLAQIKKDLILKEKTNYFQFSKWQHKPEQKEIRFFTYDERTKELLLPLFYACCLFNRFFINSRKIYPKVPPFHITFGLRDYQEEVATNSMRNFQQRGTTFLNVFCGYGKTRMGVYFSAIFAQQFGLATLVTYPRILIGNSWLGAFQKHSNAKVYVIGETPHPPEPDTQIFLCMNTRLPELHPWYRERIGHFIVDEAHMFCTGGHVPGLLSVEPMFLTMLTATYERDDGFEKMIDLMASPDRIIRISKKPFYVFQRPTQFTAEPKIGPRGIVFDDLLHKLSIIELRNMMILIMVMDNLDQKPLVLTRHRDHAHNLGDWLNHYLTPHGKKFTKMIGSGDSYPDADGFVATISKAGVGFDEEDALVDWGGLRVNLLILTASTKKIEQIAGRIFRSSDPIIFDIVDDFKNCHDHWNIRRRWYEPRNGQIYMIPGMERFTWSHFQQHLKSGAAIPQMTVTPVKSSDITRSHAGSALARYLS